MGLLVHYTPLTENIFSPYSPIPENLTIEVIFESFLKYQHCGLASQVAANSTTLTGAGLCSQLPH